VVSGSAWDVQIPEDSLGSGQREKAETEMGKLKLHNAGQPAFFSHFSFQLFLIRHS
jgi:hypothetical protein